MLVAYFSCNVIFACKMFISSYHYYVIVCYFVNFVNLKTKHNDREKRKIKILIGSSVSFVECLISDLTGIYGLQSVCENLLPFHSIVGNNKMRIHCVYGGTYILSFDVVASLRRPVNHCCQFMAWGNSRYFFVVFRSWLLLW